MFPISSRFSLTIEDFRRASYFGFIKRMRTALRVMSAVIVGAIVYTVVQYVARGRMDYLGLFVVAAYVVWLAYQLVRVERGIRAYYLSADSLLGCEQTILFERDCLRIVIAAKKIDIAQPYPQLAFAFELSSLFLVYMTSEAVYVVPKRCLSDDDVRSIRALLHRKLADRFESRYG